MEPEYLTCMACGARLGMSGSADEELSPSPETLYKRGRVPVPNLGWFCDQDCAGKFELQYDVRFDRDENGKVDYYADES